MAKGDEIAHCCRVAKNFPLWSEAFWLGIFHDSVEDGYLPVIFLRWTALDAITRRKDEVYSDYIKRVALHPVAKRVKVVDLQDNMSRNGGAKPSLLKRYEKALSFLIDKEVERRFGRVPRV